MPAKSIAQQRAAGMALAAKRGKIKPSLLRGAAREMYNSMSRKELRKFAGTKHKKLPPKKTMAESLVDLLLDGQDDIHQLPLSRAQKAYARLTSAALELDSRGVPKKVGINDKRIKDATNQNKFYGAGKGPMLFPNMDKVGPVKHAWKTALKFD
jgi:hypothetical protein